MAEKLFEEKFAVMHFLDSIRWQESSGNYLINFAYPNLKNTSELSADEKILTHWLSYITERQMPFQQIWDKGGFIFSEIVHEYKDNKGIYHFPDFKSGFFRKTEDEGYEFASKITYSDLNASQKRRLELYYTNEQLEEARKSDMNITFKSRFYTDDYLCILYTLKTLAHEKFGGSLTKYLSLVIEKIYKMENLTLEEKIKYCVLGMAYALHRMTYSINFSYNGKRISYKESEKNLNVESFVNSNEFDLRVKAHKKNIITDIFDKDGESFCEVLEKFFDMNTPENKNKEKFSMKRTWCSLRDYLKFPEYKKWFSSCIRSCTENTVDEYFLNKLFSDENNSSEACRWLELPGDVWNENSIFRRCITVQTKGKLGEVIRNEYNNIPAEKRVGYPEEFDTTFDFVPRMCEKTIVTFVLSQL